MDKFRGGEPSPFDTVPVEAYQVLVRELIIAILSGSSGLQLKLSQSKSGHEIFCRIRAPLVRERVRASSESVRMPDFSCARLVALITFDPIMCVYAHSDF